MRREKVDAGISDKDVYRSDFSPAYKEFHVGMEAATMEEPST